MNTRSDPGGGYRFGTDFFLEGGLIPEVAPTIPSREKAGGGLGTDVDFYGGLIPEVSRPLRGNGARCGVEDSRETIIPVAAQAIRSNYGDGSPDIGRETLIPDVAHAVIPNGMGSDGIESGRETVIIEEAAPGGFSHMDASVDYEEGVAPTLRARNAIDGNPAGMGGASVLEPVVYDEANVTNKDNRSEPSPGDPAHTLAESNANRSMLVENYRVRRLMPVECERLFGLKDGYTAVPWRGRPASDTARYRVLGNTFGVNVVRWIGRRIARVQSAADSTA